MNQTRDYRWLLVAVFFLLLILGATILAYLKLVPTEIKNIPYYDSIGHFLLFGMLALSLDHALKRKMFHFNHFSFPIASFVVGLYAIIDESLQAFSNVRTIELSDLLFGFLGIACLTTLGRRLLINFPPQNSNAS